MPAEPASPSRQRAAPVRLGRPSSFTPPAPRMCRAGRARWGSGTDVRVRTNLVGERGLEPESGNALFGVGRGGDLFVAVDFQIALARLRTGFGRKQIERFLVAEEH